MWRHILNSSGAHQHNSAPKNVLVISSDGAQLGVMGYSEAEHIAYNAGLDLVIVSPDAEPPVAKIMDYGKYKYEQGVKAQENRKHQTRTIVKEIKFRPNIERHDYNTKVRHILNFLSKGYHVKASVHFKGREQTHPEIGMRIMSELLETVEMEGLGRLDAPPKMEGRTLLMTINPA